MLALRQTRMSRRLSLARLALPALLVAPGVARAAEGMPQLAFGNPLLLSQIVWLAVIFVALYLLLTHWGLPRVSSVLAMREETIQADLDVARGAKARADEAVRELTEASARARAESQASINQASDAAKRQAATEAEAANARLEQQLQDSEARIGAARAAAMGALRQVATETASAVVSRLANRPADDEAVERAVGSALAARGHQAA